MIRVHIIQIPSVSLCLFTTSNHFAHKPWHSNLGIYLWADPTVDNNNYSQGISEVWKNALGERHLFYWQWCQHTDKFWKPCTFLTRHFLSHMTPMTGQLDPIAITNRCMPVLTKLVTSKIILKNVWGVIRFLQKYLFTIIHQVQELQLRMLWCSV